MGGFLTGKAPKNVIQFTDTWEPIKASQILRSVNDTDIGTYIIEFPEFQYLNDFQKRALEALVEIKKQKKRGIYNEETKNTIFKKIIDDEANNDKKVQGLITETENKVRIEQLLKKLDEADLAGKKVQQQMLQEDLEKRLQALMKEDKKGGKKTNKNKKKTKGKGKKKNKTKGKGKKKNKTRK